MTRLRWSPSLAVGHSVLIYMAAICAIPSIHFQLSIPIQLDCLLLLRQSFDWMATTSQLWSDRILKVKSSNKFRSCQFLSIVISLSPPSQKKTSTSMKEIIFQAFNLSLASLSHSQGFVASQCSLACLKGCIIVYWNHSSFLRVDGHSNQECCRQTRRTSGMPALKWEASTSSLLWDMHNTNTCTSQWHVYKEEWNHSLSMDICSLSKDTHTYCIFSKDYWTFRTL